MAKQYGGKHSPQGQPGKADTPRDVTESRQVDAAGARANVLFVPGVVLAFTSINEAPTTMATGLIAAGVLTLAAWLLRDGLRAEAAYDARKIARRPAIPRKMFASALTGCGVGVAALSNGSSILNAGLYGVVAAGLHVAAFGIDPLKNKRMEGVDTFQQDRVARVVDEAENYLSSMADHIAALKDRKLDIRVAQFRSEARNMIRTVEEDPRDLTGARKYLGIYLMGASDASVKFADHYKRVRDDNARSTRAF